MAKLYEDTLSDLALADERIVVMTAENRAAIRSLPKKLGPRFIDVGIAEQTMIGAAAGLALRGRIPVVHALATFLTMRAYEFIRTDVGIGNLPVKLVGAVPGFLSDGNGPTHQALEDVAIMRGIPGMEVFCPADESELAGALPTLIARPAPCYIRFPPYKSEGRHSRFEMGRAEVIGEGNEVAILTYGFLVKEALLAVRAMASTGGPSARVFNMRTLKPVDREAILSAARTARLVVVLEDHFKTGGLYSIVAETLLGAGVTCQVLPISLDERWFSAGKLRDVLARERCDAAGIAARIAERYSS